MNGYDNLKSFNNYGMCYEANTPYGQSYFCIPINTYQRQINNGTESYVLHIDMVDNIAVSNLQFLLVDMM